MDGFFSTLQAHGRICLRNAEHYRGLAATLAGRFQSSSMGDKGSVAKDREGRIIDATNHVIEAFGCK